MKHSHLRQIVEYLKQYTHIKAAYRVGDSVVKMVFDSEKVFYFNMRKGDSFVAKCASNITRSKVYNAPFDTLLAKRINRSKIEDVTLYKDDKIVRFKVRTTGSYRHFDTLLQLEFTGKTTNIMILDEDEVVLEALRHVDSSKSYRVVKVSQKLLPPPPLTYSPKEYPLEDVETYLYGVCKEQSKSALEALKSQKVRYLQKKISTLERELSRLHSEESLEEEAMRLQNIGSLVLSNLHNIKPYCKRVELVDYSGESVFVELDREFAKVEDIGNYYFKKAKKLKQKSRSLYIERESLSSKIEHTKCFLATVERAKEMEHIRGLFPKQSRHKKIVRDDSVESFYIEGYRVQLGKNERGNIKLLQKAKAKDIWFHLKDRPSTHVFITTDKQQVPQVVLEAAAKLCVSFSTTAKGKFEVDYTQRREVKIQEGANVLYNNYNTMVIEIT